MGSYVCADQSGRAKCEFDSMVVPKAEDMVNANERICTFVDVDGCRLTFVYGFTDETGELQVIINTDLLLRVSCFDAGVGGGNKGMWKF